jgi:dTDP-4-dehydrorhamnose reductase
MDLRNKKILVTGANGQLGYAIVYVFKLQGIDVIGTDRSILDISNQVQVNQVIHSIKPDIIIHCAAYTAVDKAESDKQNAYNTNVNGTRNLVQVAKELNIEFIYFSTDYVFDGTKVEPYETDDIPNPINYYGLTKYLGEEIIQTLLTKYYIFRISWVFGPNGNNFVKTVLRLSKERESINVVSDQVGSPTYTMDVAEFLTKNISIDYGIHHLTNEGYISWYEFSKEIIEFCKLDCEVNPILSFQYTTTAKRALNSRLYQAQNILKNWKIALHEYLSIIKDSL